MSRILSPTQISTLIDQLPDTKFGKIDWRSSPKLVARIVKALINSKEGIVTLVAKASGVHNQTLYAIMRGKTPDGGKEWPELREALSKMKCEWRGGISKTSTAAATVAGRAGRRWSALLPVTSESLTEVFSTPVVTETNSKPVKKRKMKVIGKKVSTQVQKVYDFETKELVIVTTVRYTIDGDSLTDLLNA